MSRPALRLLPFFVAASLGLAAPAAIAESSPGAREILEALQRHATAKGATRPVVFSPNAMLIRRSAEGFSLAGLLTGWFAKETFAVADAHAAGHPVVPWTVNDAAEMAALLRLGVDGLISDRPDLLRQAVEQFDADGDGKPGDYLDAQGLIDPARFDAEAHRGGRDLRPENTLPSFESGLDTLVNTLETDCGITSDGVPVLSHDPEVHSAKARLADGRALPADLLIHTTSLAALQGSLRLDRLLPDRPLQRADFALSPVAAAFAEANQLPSPYVLPTLRQLFAFTRFYADYYRTGPGRTHPEAARRAANAARVRFNIETKLTPQLEQAGHTLPPGPFAHAVAGAIAAEGLEARCSIQSFDVRTLLVVQHAHPRIQTVWLSAELSPLAATLSGWNSPVPGAVRCEACQAP
jgi:glycerophosphoryl diester phosphodiesterase